MLGRRVLIFFLIILLLSCLAQNQKEITKEKKVKKEENKTIKIEPNETKPSITLIKVSEFKAKEYISGIASINNYTAITSWDDHVYLLKDNTLQWKFKTKGSANAVAISKNYIVATSYLIPNGVLYLLDYKGNVMWNKTMPELCSGLDINEDGNMIVVGCRDGNVYAYSLEGEPLWKFSVAKSAWGVWDVVIKDNKIAIASDDAFVYLLNKEGEMLWKASQGRKSYLYAVDLFNDSIAVASQDKMLYYYQNQKLKWKFMTNFSNSDVAFSQDGSYIALTSLDKNLYILNKKGKLLQKIYLGDEATAVAFSEERVIVGLKNGGVIFFAPKVTKMRSRKND